MPYRVKGIAGLRYTDEEMSVAGLAPDGKHIQGWVMTPTGRTWQPEDLLWLPPSATKATDVDRAGRIVDVTFDPGETMAFVTAETNKHERYLDFLRDKVRAGAMRLTAALAKMLGLNFGDGAELTPWHPAEQRLGASMKAASDLQAMIDATGPVEGSRRREVDVKAIAHAAAQRYVSTGDLGAAMDDIFQAVRSARGQPAPIDPDTGLPIVRS